MITNYEELKRLIKETYEKTSMFIDSYGVLIVKKSKNVQVTFEFRDFIDWKSETKLDCLHEMYVGHKCLTFGFWNGNEQSGGGYMEVCDSRDLSNEIIDYIDKHLALPKIVRHGYVQLSLFGGTL